MWTRLPRKSARVRGPAATHALVLVAAVSLAVLVVACAPAADTSFDPSTACDPAVRQQMAGAYPDLEARIPTTILGEAASRRDSGRFCSKETLGSVYDAGVTETRFGGAIWEFGDRGGIQLGAFEGDGLTPAMLAEEYRRAADTSRRTEGVKATTLEVAGRPAWRIDVVNGNSRQAVVVWGSADGRVVQAVVAADVEEAQLQAAISAFR